MNLTFPTLPSAQTLCDAVCESTLIQIRGRVAAVSGGNIEIEGMTAPVGAVCRIRMAGNQTCLARLIGFQGVRPILAPLAFPDGVAAGDEVELLATRARIHVGPELRGRVINALGEPIDGRPLPAGLQPAELERDCPDSLKRPAISKPLETGVRAIDAFLTCGLGQRIGIFAGSGVGKSTLLSMLVQGTAADTIVVGMVGERGREVREFIEHSLGPDGMKRTIMVAATSDQPAALRVQAAWTATAVAESLRDAGQNVLLLIDSVTRFALAQREIGLAAGEPPTTRGYPPSVFAMLPRLVERAGTTEQGSITAFYSVLVEGDDTNEPIADTLRGLLDGHVVLSRELASQSHWPAIDILASLSRLQTRVVSPEVREAAEILRRSMAEYKRNEDLINIGAYKAGSNPHLDQAIAIREPLKQLICQATLEAKSGQTDRLTQTHLEMVRLANALKGVNAALQQGAETPQPNGGTP
ncbi:putative ATP synthase YscN [Roseimaritima multifibrata]|uniref:Putative ATP synthase YscN n=1 Tax=Roseimaritima multifibrata TaxID=1930274 RepID=A0A517MKP7_9BACT|nr:FliI/YscN family ATPase [Roseimaritima multifibrata]QDS95459.1 putative ATP synthase YscN [Roseimaritima multifibrata]